MKMLGVDVPKIVTDKTIGGKVLLLPPDWMPRDGEPEAKWIERIGPRAAVIINVLVGEGEGK